VFVQTTLGYNALQSGLTLLPTTLMLIIAAMVATRLVNGGRRARKPIVIFGFLLIACGGVIVALTFGPDSSGWALAPGLAVAGLGLGLTTILPDLVQSSAPPGEVSDVSGLSNSFCYLGQSVGVALAGALMVAVLLQSFTDNVNRSAVLNAQQKTQVNTSVAALARVTAISDDQLRATLQNKGVTGQTQDELVRVNADARDQGLAAAVLGMVLFALAGGALALRLPGKKTRDGSS
jgi:Na+/melibiose symporter-like transporter